MLPDSPSCLSRVRAAWRTLLILVGAGCSLGWGKAWSETAAPWAAHPLKETPPPAVRHEEWPKVGLDRFILARLEQQGFAPAPAADPLTLLRRATFDLTGLPPTPEEIDAFLADHTTNAFARVVDRLLGSRAYGEHWGRHWLDVVRYADTAGDTADYPVGLAWRYRNYVIDSFQSDKPYDEFLREQIAGDILADRGSPDKFAERVTATGFLAISRRFGFDSENYQHLTIQDTLDTLGQSVLGLSLGCARCHDHKFDPISMKDYYALYGIFASTRYAFPGSEQKGKLRAMVPLVPRAQSQVLWHEFDLRLAELAQRITSQKKPAPAAWFRSLHDPDGDFEIQKDAAGGSYGVVVPPWLSEGKMSVSANAQSPFKNLYPAGRFGVNLPGGDQEYRLAQSLYPRRTPATGSRVYLNLDFRPAAHEASATAKHRFWLGAQSGSPAIELLISSEALFQRNQDQIEKLADLGSNQWHNLQLVIDLSHRAFSGSLGQPHHLTTFSNRPFSPDWSGSMDMVTLDSQARAGGKLPALDLDNFGLEDFPIPPFTTIPLANDRRSSQPDPAALQQELQQLVGLDGDFEWQAAGAAPSEPWNAGPNSVVKTSPVAQSPFHNLFPPGNLGVEMPNRAEYDGLGLTLATPWSSSRTTMLNVSFDFRCGHQELGGDGTWRYYVGHGAGSSGAVEVEFNGSEFFARSGTSHASVARLQSGHWYQVQLQLDLKAKTYTGSLASRTGSTPFAGSFVTGWDGTIDYAFIDSYGHLPGVRPALQADNFAFQESALRPLDATELAESGLDRDHRQARISELRQQLNAQAAQVPAWTRELTDQLEHGACDMAYGVVEGTPHNERLQLRGDPEQPSEVIPRGFLRALGGQPLPPGTVGSGRLELAQWLTSAVSPLTARVMANRIWQYHFGRGLVTTPNDFGARGQRPSHPELLDYLASRFIQGGWSIKSLHRQIMLSATYQAAGPQTLRPAATSDQAGSPPPGPDAFACFEPRRLSAEELRDTILAISGQLDATPGQAHPFPSPVNASYTQHGPFIGVYDHQKRSVYLMTQRIKRHPFLALFDGPDPNTTTAERRVTTVPTQALFFLNSPFIHEQSRIFAKRLQSDQPDDEHRVELAWRLTTGRTPTSTERTEAAGFLANYRAELLAAGEDDATAPLAAYVRTLFCSNEFLHLD